LAADTEKFTAAENPPKKFIRPQSGRKNNSTAARFFAAVEFYTVYLLNKPDFKGV